MLSNRNNASGALISQLTYSLPPLTSLAESSYSCTSFSLFRYSIRYHRHGKSAIDTETSATPLLSLPYFFVPLTKVACCYFNGCESRTVEHLRSFPDLFEISKTGRYCRLSIQYHHHHHQSSSTSSTHQRKDVSSPYFSNGDEIPVYEAWRLARFTNTARFIPLNELTQLSEGTLQKSSPVEAVVESHPTLFDYSVVVAQNSASTSATLSRVEGVKFRLQEGFLPRLTHFPQPNRTTGNESVEEWRKCRRDLLSKGEDHIRRNKRNLRTLTRLIHFHEKSWLPYFDVNVLLMYYHDLLPITNSVEVNSLIYSAASYDIINALPTISAPNMFSKYPHLFRVFRDNNAWRVQRPDLPLPPSPATGTITEDILTSAVTSVARRSTRPVVSSKYVLHSLSTEMVKCLQDQGQGNPCFGLQLLLHRFPALFTIVVLDDDLTTGDTRFMLIDGEGWIKTKKKRESETLATLFFIFFGDFSDDQTRSWPSINQ